MPISPSANGPSRRVTSTRLVDSNLTTSAPRWANWVAANGPAHTHVMSTTRTPPSGAGPSPTSPPIDSCAAGRSCHSSRTSDVCAPSAGLTRRSGRGVSAKRHGGVGASTLTPGAPASSIGVK